MTTWRWPAYCITTFVLVTLFFRFLVEAPRILPLGVAIVVLGVLGIAFATSFENNGGPLPPGKNDVLAALGWLAGLVGLGFFPSEPAWAWIVGIFALLTVTQRYVSLRWDV